MQHTTNSIELIRVGFLKDKETEIVKSLIVVNEGEKYGISAVFGYRTKDKKDTTSAWVLSIMGRICTEMGGYPIANGAFFEFFFPFAGGLFSYKLFNALNKNVLPNLEKITSYEGALSLFEV